MKNKAELAAAPPHAFTDLAADKSDDFVAKVIAPVGPALGAAQLLYRLLHVADDDLAWGRAGGIAKTMSQDFEEPEFVSGACRPSDLQQGYAEGRRGRLKFASDVPPSEMAEDPLNFFIKVIDGDNGSVESFAKIFDDSLGDFIRKAPVVVTSLLRGFGDGVFEPPMLILHDFMVAELQQGQLVW